MRKSRMLVCSLALSLVVWGVFTWPLAKYVTTGIPASSTNVEAGAVRRMIEGDHLQLLYNYWIFSDMLFGRTPMWHNIYEFNTGDDAARRYVGMDLMPYSLVFTAGYGLVNRAFGWNLLLFVSLWLSYLLSWLLVRRYTRDLLASAVGALLVVFLPYRWMSLMGGSPTGISMLLPPLLFLGLDQAVRDRNPWGGAMAGLALLVASWNDAHIFFLGVLATPCWCVLAWLADPPSWKRRDLLRLGLALLPCAVIGGYPILGAMLSVSRGDSDGTNVAEGRSLHETALFSPRPEGLTAWMAGGHENSIYLGYLLPILLAAGLILLVWRLARRPAATWREALVFALLLVGAAALILVSFGINGPGGGRLFHFARARVPHFDMIRQPAKCYSILPPLLSVCAGLALKSVLEALPGRKRWLAPAFACAVAVLLGATYACQVRATVCLLDEEQGAYAAVADDARAAEIAPRALIIPIWPGDSAWASLYEHYVSLYRIRMINGYLPVVPVEYVQNIALFHEFANVGLFTEATWSDLRRRGIDYLVFHENAFPEQVSNFPAVFTLFNLLRHPRLELLGHDGSVWSFKMLEEPREKELPPAMATWTTFFATHNGFWEAEWGEAGGNAAFTEEATAFGGRAIRLAPGGGSLRLPVKSHCGVPGATLLVRARGRGILAAEFILDNKATNRAARNLESDRWTWCPLPLGDVGASRDVTPVLSATEGEIIVDSAILFGGQIPELQVGESWTLPGPLFFRGGFTDLDKNTAVLRPDYESGGGRWGIFYGPKLPLPPGEYEIRLHVRSDAAPGTELGSFHIKWGGRESEDFPVVAGREAVGHWSNDDAMPVNVAFTYSRLARMEIDSVEFKKTGETAGVMP